MPPEKEAGAIAVNSDSDFDDTPIAELRRMPNRVVTTRPPALGYASTVFLIVNRMIGTGIFLTPTAAAHGTHSVAYTLLFWAAGAIVAICGAHVFAEFGLSVPRMTIDGEKQAVPRNGGEKNYIEYVVKKPTFLATCLYGIPFIVLGTVAGNALVFAMSIFRAAGIDEPNDLAVRGFAIGIITFCCFLHGFWRRAGIWLNNFFGFCKLAILLMIFTAGVAYTAGAFGGSTRIAAANFNVRNSTSDARTGAYGYAEAFLATLFAYGGFNQASYVFGEVEDPRRQFKPVTMWTVAGVGTLYMLVNLAYMMVVPAFQQFSPGDDTVAANFFNSIFGENANQIQYALMAFSSLGNLLVQTFTAARVKQEIAKEGILPFSKFIADNKNLTPRFLKQHSQSNVGKLSEATPLGAFCLHWVGSAVLILASIPDRDSAESYHTYVSLYSFVIDAVFGFAVGLGILYLRFNPKAQWSSKSTSNKYISICTAFVFTTANCFPLIAVWFRPSSNSGLELSAKWWTTGSIGTVIFGVAFLWWVGLRYIVPRFNGQRELKVEREATFETMYGYRVVIHEITTINWRTQSSATEEHGTVSN